MNVSLPESVAAIGTADFEDVLRQELWDVVVGRYEETDIAEDMTVDRIGGTIYVDVPLVWMTSEIDPEDRSDLARDRERYMPESLDVEIDVATGEVYVRERFAGD